MQVLHILRNPSVTSHSYNSSEGSSSQALDIQRRDQEKGILKVCFSALLLCRVAMAEPLEEDLSLNLVGHMYRTNIAPQSTLLDDHSGL